MQRVTNRSRVAPMSQGTSEAQPRIPDIPPVPEPVLDAARDGNLVIFVGSGVTKHLTGRDWDELASWVVDDMARRQEINFYDRDLLLDRGKKDAKRILTMCENLGGDRSLVRRRIADKVRLTTESVQADGLLVGLYSMNAIYLTTNWDNGLDILASGARSDLPAGNASTAAAAQQKVFFREDDMHWSNMDAGNVLHIHGSIADPDTMVITERDYSRVHREGRPVPALLDVAISDYVVLFIGAGCSEQDIIGRFLERRRPQLPTNVAGHYTLMGFYASEPRAVELERLRYSQSGIDIVPFDMTRLQHDQLKSVVGAWSRQIRCRPVRFTQQARLIEEATR